MITKKNVQIIQPTIGLEAEKLIRVAAYCRVSTDSDDQADSFLAQVKYYNDFFKAQSNMVLVDIYADATDIIGLKQNPTNGRRFSPIFFVYRAFSA